MTPQPTIRARVARRLHGWLLRLAPRQVLQQCRAEMTATFNELCDRADAEGFWSVLRLLAREAADLVRARRTEEPASALPLERNIRMSSLQINQIGRSLVRRPAFAVTAILTLAVGTAATTTLFAVVETVLLRPLPYPDADRLVTVYEASPSARERTSLIAPGRLEDWNRLNRTFTAISGSYAESVTDTSGADPERLDGRRVSPRYFAVFGADPLVGRAFTADEERADGPGAVVISEGFWTRRFGRDLSAVGRSLQIGGKPFSIVGVMPASFSSSTIDLWLPAQVNSWLLTQRDARFVSGVGRLKPGVTLAQAADDLGRVQKLLGDEFPKTDKGWSATVADLKDARVGDRRTGLWLVFGAVSLVWLIAVANVAGLVLVEANRRARELAIRSALGASRGQVVGIVTADALVISGAGGALGLALAAWLVGLARASMPTLPRAMELGIDWRVVAFVAITSLATAALAGLLPALASTRRSVARSLSQGGRSVSGGSHGAQRFLVLLQVALGVVLCGSAALLAKSYYNLVRVDRGFSTANVVTFHVGARWDEDRTRVGQIQQTLVESLERVPGVRAAGLANFLPASGATLRYQVSVDGLTGPDTGGAMTVGSRSVTAGYLQSLSVPILEGGTCPAFRLDPKAQQTALVNTRFVDRFAGGANIVGRQMRLTQSPGSPMTIVGVLGDFAEDGPAADPVPYFYSCLPAGAWPDPQYVVQAADPAAFVANLRGLVRQIDPTRAVFGVRPLDDVMGAAVEQPRLDAGVVALFAATALGLAAIGLYGLFARLVDESRREIGVRLALGAAPRQMVRLVFADAGGLLAGGTAIGLVLTLGAHQLLRAVLFGIGRFDAASLAAATVTLGVVSASAIAIPALRASRVPPIEALRGD